MKYNTIITHKNRKENLYKCLDAICKDIPDHEVILVDCGEPVDVKHYKLKYIHAPQDGIFNKSKALNIGIKNSDASALGFIDCDSIVPLAYFDLFNKLYERNVARIAIIVRKEQGDLSYFAWNDWWNQEAKPPQIPVGNSHFICRRKDLVAIGGYDEFFIGRGCEDQDIMNRLNLYWQSQNQFGGYVDPGVEVLTLSHSPGEWERPEYLLRNWNHFKENLDKNIIYVNGAYFHLQTEVKPEIYEVKNERQRRGRPKKST
jgi:glycosyltransferase involved in cell wall biosynthesis